MGILGRAFSLHAVIIEQPQVPHSPPHLYFPVSRLIHTADCALDSAACLQPDRRNSNTCAAAGAPKSGLRPDDVDAGDDLHQNDEPQAHHSPDCCGRQRHRLSQSRLST